MTPNRRQPSRRVNNHYFQPIIFSGYCIMSVWNDRQLRHLARSVACISAQRFFKVLRHSHRKLESSLCHKSFGKEDDEHQARIHSIRAIPQTLLNGVRCCDGPIHFVEGISPMKHYHHLCNEERFYIWQARRERETQKQIADALGRHPSMLCRELKRNTYVF